MTDHPLPRRTSSGWEPLIREGRKPGYVPQPPVWQELPTEEQLQRLLDGLTRLGEGAKHAAQSAEYWRGGDGGDGGLVVLPDADREERPDPDAWWRAEAIPSIPGLRRLWLALHQLARIAHELWEAAGSPAKLSSTAMPGRPRIYRQLVEEAIEVRRLLDDAEWRQAIASWQWTQRDDLSHGEDGYWQIRKGVESLSWAIREPHRQPGFRPRRDIELYRGSP